MFHAVAMLFLLTLANQAHAQTRLYVNNLPQSFNPAPQGSWDDTSPNLGSVLFPLHFPCRTTKGGSAMGLANTEASTVSGYRVLVVACVSDPLAADQALGGPGSNVSWVLGAAEANSLQDNYWRAHIWVSQGSTAAVRGTLLDSYEESPANAPGNEWPAAHARGWASFGPSVPLSESPVEARAGDRVIIEIGAVLHRNSGAAYSSTLWIGGTDGGDLLPGGDETSAQGWLQFSQNLTFGSPQEVTPPTPASTATPTATAIPPNTATPSSTPNSQPISRTFTVDGVLDQPDAVADDRCSTGADGTGFCTLRAAVETANAIAGTVAVDVPAGVYQIDLGELPVTGDLIIRGTGEEPESVVVKLAGRITPRGFSVAPVASLTLENLTVLDYRNELDTALEGACIHNGGTLTLDAVVLDHCDNARPLSTPPLAKGGGVYNEGVLLTRNGTRFDTGISNWGACLFNAKQATVHLSDTTFLNCHTLGLDVEEPSSDGDTAGGGAGMFNAGTVIAERTSFIYCRARLGLGGGAILNGDKLGDAGLGTGGNITLTNVTFARNRCRRCEGGAISAYGGTINAKLTTVNATQSAFLSGIVLRDNAVLNADRVIIEGHNISNPPANFEVCYTATGAQVNVVGPAPSMDDSLDITPPRITCPGFTPANLCLMSDNDYGGLVETVRLNNSTTCRSEAIDAGGATCDETEDARGFPRPAGAGCDLGSFEVQQ
jgi:hypothetical protein